MEELLTRMDRARIRAKTDPESAHSEGDHVLVEALQVMAQGTAYAGIVDSMIRLYQDPNFTKYYA